MDLCERQQKHSRNFKEILLHVNKKTGNNCLFSVLSREKNFCFRIFKLLLDVYLRHFPPSSSSTTSDEMKKLLLVDTKTSYSSNDGASTRMSLFPTILTTNHLHQNNNGNNNNNFKVIFTIVDFYHQYHFDLDPILSNKNNSGRNVLTQFILENYKKKDFKEVLVLLVAQFRSNNDFRSAIVRRDSVGRSIDENMDENNQSNGVKRFLQDKKCWWKCVNMYREYFDLKWSWNYTRDGFHNAWKAPDSWKQQQQYQEQNKKPSSLPSPPQSQNQQQQVGTTSNTFSVVEEKNDQLLRKPIVSSRQQQHQTSSTKTEQQQCSCVIQ